MTAQPLLRWTHLAMLAMVALVAFVMVVPASTLSAATPGGSAPDLALVPNGHQVSPDIRTASPIQHVVIIIQENHGTDNYFSQFAGAFGPPPGGIPQPSTQSNVNYYGNQYTLGWNYSGNQTSSDPAHDVENINGNIDNGSMDGFFYTDSQTSDGLYPSYIVANELGLAQEYGFADNYFHAYAGPTTPNRFYDEAITSGPVTTNPGIGSSVQTVSFPSMPLELSNNSISWAEYNGNYGENPNGSCLPPLEWPTGPSCYFTTSLVQLMPSLYFWYNQQLQGQAAHLQPWSGLYSAAASGTLPAVSWYTQDWLNGTEHPGTIAGFGGNVTQGQQGILGAIRAIENSPEWPSTAIFLTYDEGGGFFDHIPPPDINGLGDGIRIPLVVISPYAKEGYVSHGYYTPSSLLHFIEWNWNVPALGTLDAMSNLPLDFFDFSATPRAPLPQFVYGGSNLLTSYPWNYTQPVGSGLTGSYTPALVANNNVTWAYQTANALLSSPVLTPDSNHLYVAGTDGLLRSFNPNTGAQQWSAALGSGSRSLPALLPNDGVIATTLRGTVVAYSSTHSVLWNVSMGAPIYGGLTTVQGKYYGSLSNGSVFAVDENGTTLWVRHVSPDRIYAPPAFDPSSGNLLVSATTGGVVGLNLQGTTLWTTPIPGGVFATGAVSAGTVYVTSTAGGVYPIATSTGTLGTPGTLPGPSVTSPLISGTTLYAGNETGLLEAFALPGLTPVWSDSLYGDVAGMPALSGTNLWVATGGGYIYELQAASGSLVKVMHSGTSFYAGPTSTPMGTFFAAEDGNVYSLLNAGIPGPGWAAGTVTNQSTGAGVVGAPLVFTSPTGPASGASSAGGSYNVSMGAGTYAVYVNATGYHPFLGSVSITASKTTTYNVALTPNKVAGTPNGWAAGLVTNKSSGTAIAGAAVHFTSAKGPASGVASATGAYNVSLTPGTWAVYVNQTGYVPFLGSFSVSSSTTTPFNIPLVPSLGWAAGTVTNQSSSSALSGVNVLFVSPSGRTTATTVAAGTYNTSLAPGSYAVFANQSHYQSYQGSLYIRASHTSTLNIALVPGAPGTVQPGTIAGTVYKVSASPSNELAGISITFMPGGLTTTSGSSGAYTLSATPGTYSVFVNASGYQSYLATAISVSSSATTQKDIILAPSSCTGNCGGSSTGTGSSINWVLWGLIIAAVAAAIVILAVVLSRRKHEAPPEPAPTYEELAAAAAAPGGAAYSEGPPSGAGGSAGSSMEPPPEGSPPTDQAG